jgi:electron transport complex protein RnfB
MHNVINDLCTGCELCIEPCPVDCIELIDVDEDQSLVARNHSEYFFDLKLELKQRKNKKTKMNKSIAENLDLAELINQKIGNRNTNKQKSIKKLQLEILDSQKSEKYISESDIEELKKQL